jgi:signal transduction histidine kinase
VQHELLRIAQEAIHNAVRHANPTVIAVTLQWDAPNLLLQVEDNGSGISAARLEKGEGFPLSISASLGRVMKNHSLRQ